MPLGDSDTQDGDFQRVGFLGGGGVPEAHGRLASAGTYPAGRIWSQIVGAPTPTDSPTAKLADDEQIIVLLDSQTGEVRQCGNVSGYCLGMNPWAKPVTASAPLALGKHADQLDAEDRAKTAEPAAH